MELKAVTAKYGNADQLAKYKEALGAKNARNILMWLVAPTIPTIDSGVFGPHRN